MKGFFNVVSLISKLVRYLVVLVFFNFFNRNFADDSGILQKFCLEFYLENQLNWSIVKNATQSAGLSGNKVISNKFGHFVKF